ncbi:alpha/beta hydrolase [Aquitalea sp.]|jgi:esterase|uniref:alpha/beta fold hydrolase n=1 Tax=Aquitalea sp. TaxID=1872623 RepID=UPI00258704D9|nr:alpha/beta hydrolase [Aquitalea sp.]
MPNSYHRVGSGPHHVIVLHGWFGDRHSFAPLEGMLNQQAFSYLFMDYRGYGDMQCSTGSFTIDEIARDALELADTLQLDRFSLIGHSMGGMVIERIASLQPQRVISMVGIAPVPCGGVALDDLAISQLYAAVDSLEGRQAIIDRSTGHRLPRKWLEWKAVYSWQHSIPQAFKAYLAAWLHTDFSEEVIGRTTPFKLITGAHDPVFNGALMQSTTMQRYPNAIHEVQANAGHYPMNETPLSLLISMETFLHEA